MDRDLTITFHPVLTVFDSEPGAVKLFLIRRWTMDKKEFRKILAGLSIAGLLSSAALPSAGCATDGQAS
jgi:radical SAM modification target selenobiotic family peptide